MKLTVENLNNILKDSLLSEDEIAQLGLDELSETDAEFDPDDLDGFSADELLAARGIVNTYVFNPVRLTSHKTDIVDFLDQLEPSFHANSGGGMSLMNMVATKDGDLWGEQYHADLLACMAIALSLGKWVLPREMWGMLPGSMPYFVVHAKEAGDGQPS